MAVHDLDCPNCGAPVHFGSGSRATCSFCRSQLYLGSDGVRAESVLNDLLENQPVVRDVDVDRIRQLVQDDKKIDAIKLVREQTGVGLKEAKDAVEAIERGETPDLRSPLPNPPGQAMTSTTYRPPRQSASTVGCLLGCLPMLLFFGLCAGLVMLSSHVMFRAFGPLDQALTIINNDPAVVQAFGTPITPGAFVTGEMSGGGSSTSAGMSLPIYGPKRGGELNVSGSWRRGVWDLSIRVVYEQDGEEQTIYMTRRVK